MISVCYWDTGNHPPR